jgi:hypothetical protein
VNYWLMVVRFAKIEMRLAIAKKATIVSVTLTSNHCISVILYALLFTSLLQRRLREGSNWAEVDDLNESDCKSRTIDNQ